ncbi:glutathione S-transferase omega-1-like [Eleutherodactylus coqui]|uniref:Glutathione S-transferase omega n=1 Tax=Eleutherodactylus coqui TaxID=57060 RepID=A0A8J6FCE8_ELECQ|nr:hypothetical protein GDO78_008074 [Eleutherodactylus coqui]
MSGSQRSLAKGSPAPGPVPEGVIRLYSMRFCPFPQRVQLVLLAKGIKHEVVNINLKSKPDWFFEKSPPGLVPSIETSDGKIVYDSSIVCDYLDETFPEKKLIPEDPYEKARQKMILEDVNAVTAVMYKILYAPKDNRDATELKAQFFEQYKKLEEALTKTNTPYFCGESVTLIDYIFWPFFERFIAFDVLDFVEKTPRMKAWGDLMLQDPAVKETLTEPDALVKFYELYCQDSLDAADYGLD